MTLKKWLSIGPRGRDSRGQSFVEMALLLPMLLTLVMGVVDLGMVLYAHSQVAAASGEGARQGAIFTADQTEDWDDNDDDRLVAIRNAIFNTSTGYSSLGLLKPSDSSRFVVATDVIVSYSPTTGGSPTRTGELLTVTVRYRQPVLFTFLPGLVGDKMQVSSSTQWRIP